MCRKALLDIYRGKKCKKGPCEVLSYLLDKFRERFSNGAVTGPPLKQNKTVEVQMNNQIDEDNWQVVRNKDI